MRRRLPIESSQPLVVFGLVRIAVSALAFLVLLPLDVPDRGPMLLVLGAAAVPWSLLVLVASQRDPDATMIPLVAAGDMAILVLLEAVAPGSYGAVRSVALFLIAVHSHFQGEWRGVMIAGAGAGALVLTTVLRGEAPASNGLLAFYETVFVLAALATALLIGRLRTTESASRLRARLLSRRTIRAEGEIRRRVAEAIHDGPVQSLIGLDMMLGAAHQAAERGDGARAGELIKEARGLVTDSVQTLRDEIVGLGPYAFEELSYATAIENCIPAWKRRYGFEVMAAIEQLELPPEMAGDLFLITQEAVVNAGRHARAQAVSISLRSVGDQVELRVTDNGEGFDGQSPLGATEPGHLGLASMRERAELMNGELEFETSELGTKVVVRAPLAPV